MAIESTPNPSNHTDLRIFLGLLRYYWWFMKLFAEISEFMQAGSSGTKGFECTKEMGVAFLTFKKALSTLLS